MQKTYRGRLSIGNAGLCFGGIHEVIQFNVSASLNFVRV